MNVLLRVFGAIHVFLYQLTGGRIGGTFTGYGSPVLLLKARGRKSGQERTTPLIYGRDGDDLVIIASKAGDPRHPAWWLNLRANPDARVQVGGDVIKVHAEEVDGPDRERLWKLMTDIYAPYDDYQKKTTRRIPVVRLRPAA